MATSRELDRSAALKVARRNAQRKAAARTAKNQEEIREPSFQTIDFLIFLALLAAILKDLSDLIFGWIPGIVTVISFCVSIFIAMMMFLHGAGGKRRLAKKVMRRFMVLITGTVFEAFLPFINFLPIESLTVFLIYLMIVAERKQIIKSPQ